MYAKHTIRERVFHMIKHKKIIVSALLSLTVLAGSFAAAFAVPAFQPKAKYLSVADIRGIVEQITPR